MPTDVIMPQMGESIAEGTILRWMKQLGERVERDEPLFEISTDKVDAEIPAPVAGTLLEILVLPNTTVPINTIVARIGASGETATATPKQDIGEETRPILGHLEPTGAPMIPTSANRPAESAPAPSAATDSSAERIRTKSSPLVRAIAAREGIDISSLSGSGIHGRVTKDDILGHLESRKSAPVSAPSPQPRATATSEASVPASGSFVLVAGSLRPTELPPLPPAYRPDDRVTIEPMTVMRRRIAENMALSRKLNAHVTTFFEFDWGKVDAHRSRHRARFEEQHGVKLTYLPFLLKAVCAGLRAFPTVNALIDGDQIVFKHEVNIGIAVALDWGLIVPVIRHADELSLAGLAKTANDLATRARSKQLKLDELGGGTFSITNPGIFGGLIGTPIVPVGQSAILGFGGIEKRPVVVSTAEGQDAIVIRPRSYMALSFDHRLIDGALADQFLAHVKTTIETADWPELG